MPGKFCVSLTHAKNDTDKATVGFVVENAAVGSDKEELDAIEDVDAIVARGRRAIEVFGAERVLLTSDCGFATFADSPVASASVAAAKVGAIARAAAVLRRG
jgi:5-methyltetrahydropteroyltriglutamate--homocysteine methyltransferase